MESKDFTFEETIEILKRVNKGWTKYSMDHQYGEYNNPYEMMTEKTFPRYNDTSTWEEIGMFTLPFVESPRSQEVANHECIHYYESNNKEYIWIGEYRYVVTDTVRNILKDFLD